MRIGFNLFNVVLNEGKGPGALMYVDCLIRKLAELDDKNRYLLFVSSAGADVFSNLNKGNVQQIEVPYDSRRKWFRPVFEQIVLPRLVRQYSIDVLHSPFSTAPLVCPCLNVMTIHDLVYHFYHKHFPGYMRTKSLYYRLSQPLMAHTCDIIITVSDFCRREIIRILGVSQEKVFVTHESSTFIIPETFLALSASKLADNHIMLLAVASGMPHKNLIRLIQAMRIIVDCFKKPIKLHIVGQIGKKTNDGITDEDLRNCVKQQGLEQNVSVIGYVSMNELMSHYRNATALIYPSLYEGFGLPVLEAMQNGVPVICSDNASLPEVAGAAALYFDPYSVNDIADKALRLLTSKSLRQQMISRGYDQARKFSWSETALATLGIYKSGFSSWRTR